MYRYDLIKNIHLEVSSLCNAECSICNRRVNGGPKNPTMIERFISLKEYKEWFDADLIKQLESITLCGNYGDPMTNPELIPIMRYTKELNPDITFHMNTNASGRDKQFWTDLADVIGKSGNVVFSVDGLEDTNHIYRKGTNWKKIMNAMEWFTAENKSHAVWEFLVFKHNQHQIQEARLLSESLGFTSFHAKKAMGFSDKHGLEMKSLKHDGTLDYYMQAPDDEWRNEKVKKKQIVRKHGASPAVITKKTLSFMFDHTRTPVIDEDPKELEGYDNCKINCTAIRWSGKDLRSIFVASTGLVFPCCFTASKYYGVGVFETLQLRNFIKEYGEETIDLSKGNTVKSITDSELFQIGYNKSWLKSTHELGKLLTCSKFCGSNVNTEILSTKKSVQRSGEYNV